MIAPVKGTLRPRGPEDEETGLAPAASSHAAVRPRRTAEASRGPSAGPRLTASATGVGEAGEPSNPDEQPDGGAPHSISPEQPQDLPDEYIPLTPELVEEDAQRNDFVLRLTVVLLALLLGCTEVGQTETLVHVRTGQYLAEHGVLPPRTDVFSYTAADRPWVNLSWLFDLITAGAYGLGGGVGLTILKALLAAVAFFFVVGTSRAGVSTWWGSIVAALALVVCVPQLTALPEIVTLAGVALVLWLLNRWEQGGSPWNLWTIVGAIVVWSNLDPRAWVGVLLVVLYALGAVIGRLLGRGEDEPGRTRTLGLAAAASVLAAMVNPFLWHSLLAPVSLYGDEYPAWRDYRRLVMSVKELEVFPLAGETYWRAFEVSGIVRLITIAALSLAATALAMFVLNWRRLRVEHVAVFLGFVGLALAGSRELAVAGIAWAVLANLNAQEWYRHTFRQTYSTDFSERLFATGGRFVTVLGLVCIALFAIAGNLAGPEGNRIGFGFRQPLAAEMQGLAEDLQGVPAEHRGFNLLPRTGDLMIWIGRQPFIDSRMGLYAGEDEGDLIARHLRTRDALRPHSEAIPHSGDRKVWRDVFAEYDIACVLVHLAGFLPQRQYEAYGDLTLAGDFRVTQLGSVAAVLYWSVSPQEDVRAYAQDQRIDFLKAAFRPETDVPEVPQRYDWPQPPGWYESLLNLPKPRRTTAMLKASHYDMHVQLAMAEPLQVSPDVALAVAHLAIRHAHQALAENPSLAEAYRILGRAYTLLRALESQINVSGGGGEWAERRYLQAVNAYSQALIVDPQDAYSWRRLRELFTSRNQFDLALEVTEHVQKLLPDGTGLDAVSQRQINLERRANNQFIEGLEGTLTAINAEIDQRLATEGGEINAISYAYQTGCTLRGLELIDKLGETLRMQPQIRLLEAEMLLRAGRTQQATDVLLELEQFLEGNEPPRLRGLAAIAALTRGDFVHAADLWKDESGAGRRNQFEGVLGTLPLAAPPVDFFRRPRPFPWPADHIFVLDQATQQLPAERVVALFNAAMTHLETAWTDARTSPRHPNLRDANDLFEEILAVHPNTGLRPLVRMYYFYTSGAETPIDPQSPFDQIPVPPDLFATDAAAPVEAPRPDMP